MRHNSRWSKAGLAFTLAALFIALLAYIELATQQSWLPLDVPLPLASTQTVQPFTIIYGGPYDIEVEAARVLRNEAERHEKHKELSCHLGLPEGYGEKGCITTPRLIDFHWQLTKGSTVIGSGSYADHLDGGYSSDAIDAEFSTPALKPGRYTLSISGLSVASALATNAPHLKVQLYNGLYVDRAFELLEVWAICGVLLLVGLALIAKRFKQATRSELT